MSTVPAATAARVAAGVGMVLAVGLIPIILHCLRRRTSLPNSTLFVRWRTWGLIAPLWVASVVYAPAALVMTGIVVVQATREFATLVDLDRLSRLTLIAAAAGSLALLAISPDSWRTAAPVFVLIATIPPLLRQDIHRGATTAALSLLGFLSISFLAGFVWLVRTIPSEGASLLLTLGLAVAVSDIGAFVVGSGFGRRALAPRLSPNKTRIGVVGNVVGAYVGTAAAAFILPPAFAAPTALLLPAVIAVGCVWGDLYESMLKRQTGTKDAGAILPGFGGVFDRADSLLVAAPLFYLVLTALGQVGP